MAPPKITPLKQAIAIRPEHVATSPTRLRIQQHGNVLSSGCFTVYIDSSGGADDGEPSSDAHLTKLFSVDGKYMSWTQRRAFRDASGLPLFEVYHKVTGVTWYATLPSTERGSADLPLLEIVHRYSSFKDKFDVFVRNVAAAGEQALVEVRGQDIWKLRTNVYVGGKAVMTAKRTEKMSVYMVGKPPEWVVDVAEGMDLSLASVIVVVMAATMYDSNMRVSMSNSAGKSGGS